MPELKNIGNYFGATPDRPYHLSVGAIVLDDNQDIVCLHYPNIDELHDIYTLMSESIEPNETIEAAVNRGLQNELGCNGEIVTFLGTTITFDEWWGELGTPKEVEKSMLFFLVKATTYDQSLITEDTDAKREVVHKPITELITYMETMSVKNGMRDFNQLQIVKKAKEWIDSHPDLTSATL